MTAVLPARPLRPSRALPVAVVSPVPVRPTAGAHRAGGRVGTSPARLLLRVLRWTARRLVDLGLLVALVAFLAMAVGPHVFGYRTMTMLTSSMAPLIEPGDVVVATETPVAELEPGMIISYHIPTGDRRVVSHRVVTVEPAAGGAVSVVTKGDANEADDPWTATLSEPTVWTVDAVVPHVGDAVRLLRTPVLTQALVWGVPALVLGWVLLSVWRPADEDDETDVVETPERVSA